MSTEVGLRTQFLNWKSGLTPDLGVRPEWIVIDWWKHRGLIERLPLLPDGLKARMRGEFQLRSGLRKGPFDALYVAQERMFHGSNDLLYRQNYFVTADVTAIQLAAFGTLYNKLATGPAFYERQKHSERSERLRRATALFPWSRWVAQSMVSDYGADPETIHVIPPGVNMEKQDGRRREVDKLGEEPVNILFVGGDFYRKGGDLLLDWALRTSRRNWRLNLVTHDLVIPPHSDVRVYNRLRPNDPGLRALYAAADVFVLPTRGDCYSIAAIEAMASGLPVILSKTGGTEDIIRDNSTGFLIEPGDGEALSERLDYLLDHPERRREIGCSARQDAEERFDLHKNIVRTVGLMRKYLGK